MLKQEDAKMKKNTKIIVAVVALVAVIAAMLGVYFVTRPETSQGSKEIIVEVIGKDEASKDFKIKTDREYLGEALQDEKLVDGTMSEYGLFITTVDGYTADDANQEWWCITKDNGMVNTSADTTPIADGDHFELTLKTGYDF